MTKSRSCDVLIIGRGSAGLRAAIEAHDAGVHVLVISKSKLPHTVVARGGINAALGTMDPEDSWMMHAAGTLREGEFIADYERVEILCKIELRISLVEAREHGGINGLWTIRNVSAKIN